MILLCAHLDQMLTHAASREVEVCGVLIGRRSPAIAVEIVVAGFYHSHPRSAAVPSNIDRHESWPDHLMVIIGTTHSGLRYACSWIIHRDGLPIPVPLLPQSSSNSGH
jgi:proteasome lid subunit RPN8/RPN11